MRCFMSIELIKRWRSGHICKKFLKCKIVTDMSLSYENLFECITVELVANKTNNIFVSCLYRSPGSSLDQFNVNLEAFLDKIPQNKTIYLCGDYNIDLLKSDIHMATSNFIDIMFNFGLFPLISKPSRITETLSSLIDNIFTNDLVHNYSCGLLINDISDHLPVFLFFENFTTNRRNNFKHSKETRLINNVNIASFRFALSEQSWTSVYDSDNVDLAYENFLKIFNSLFNEYCPTKKVFLQKVYKNKLTSVLRYCENEYNKKQLEELRYDTCETWEIMNSVLK